YLQVSSALGWVSFFAVSVSLAGVYFGSFAAWLFWLVRQQSANPLLVAAGWGVCEYVPATLLVGNPWALSSYSQIPPSLLKADEELGRAGQIPERRLRSLLGVVHHLACVLLCGAEPPAYLFVARFQHILHILGHIPGHLLTLSQRVGMEHAL